MTARSSRSRVDVAELADFRPFFITALSAVVGIAAGITAYALYSLIALVSNLVFFQRVSLHLGSLVGHHLGAWVIVVPALGGIVIGLMARYGTDKIRGHGIPEAMEAVLVNRSRIAPKVALFKPISAAIAIGTGGPFGAEGPIIQTGGALGSILGQILHTTASERKVLLACGAAAGMAATFSTPIAAVILAIELLLFEFRARSFVPLVVASTLATTVHFALLGRGPMFDVAPVDFGIPGNIPWYLLFAPVCGLAAVTMSKALYWIEDRFEDLPIHWMWWPALGGLALGVIGYFQPRVLGVGYDTISDILNNRLTLAVLLAVLVFKSVALLVSLGSGTSGGLLAPMFMAGAALGATFAIIVNHLLPGVHLEPGAFALVGMAAVFGAASRATFTFIIFAFELTRNYDAVLPLMLVCVIADLIAMKLAPNSIMTEKLTRRGLRIHGEYEADVLRQVEVRQVMDASPPTVLPERAVEDLADALARHDPDVMKYGALPVVTADGRLVGVVSHGDVLRAMGSDDTASTTVDSIRSRTVVYTHPDVTLHDAVTDMLRFDVHVMPVVDPADPGKLVGLLERSMVLEARRRQLHEEHVREPGWLTSRA